MRSAIWEPNCTRAVDRLSKAELLSEQEVIRLKRSYEFLRRCESVLRRYDNRAVAALPANAIEQRNFARRMDAQTIEAFTDEYRAARSAIHQLYEERIRYG